MLNIVFAAPAGQRLDTPARKAAIEKAIAASSRRVQAHRRQGGPGQRRRPVQQGDLLEGRPHRLRGGAVRSDDRGQGPRRGRRRRGLRPRDGRAGGRDGGVQRRGRVPAARAGDVGVARPARRDHRAARRVPHLRRDADPDRAGDRGADDGVPAPVHPRRADGHQHGHADPRLDDRPRRRHRLLALHRHALQTAPPRRSLAAGRRRRGRRVRRARGAVRRPDGRDLGQRPGVLRPRLRHEARHRQRPRRADDGADRELAAARGAGAARPQGRPAQGAVPAADRRLGGGAREDARRPLGPVRDRERHGSCSRSSCCSILALAATSALVRLGAADQGTQPKKQTSRRAYDLLAEGFGAGFNGPIPIVVDINGDKQAPQQDLRRRSGPRGRGVGRTSRSSTTRRRSRSSS